MLRIVVCGARGRLRRQLSIGFAAAGHRVVELTRADLDVNDRWQIQRVIAALRPEVVVNCSAYNAVDSAEANRALAFAVNAEGPSNLAESAHERGAIVLHYSTDFVFDGATTAPYTESCRTNPLNVYGASKLAGEAGVRRVPRHYILRVASLFGGDTELHQQPSRRSTIDSITDALMTDRVVKALTDRTVSPSYVPDVVSATTALLDLAAPFGTYHCVSSGHTTWSNLAETAAACLETRGRIEHVASADVVTTARRPRFCALSNRKLETLGIPLPSWESALSRHLAARADRGITDVVT